MMELSFYQPYFTKEYMMGPNSLRILSELLQRCPVTLGESSVILDLGCGTGLTSFALQHETGGEVFANDLWIKGEDNAARFAAWGVGEWVHPFQENAENLRFEKESFDAIVSIDAYHYFAGKEGYFVEKILPFLKKGGVTLIGVPGIREAFDDRTLELITPWLGEEAYMLRSPRQWRSILGFHPDMASLEVGEMDCFEDAWADWLATDNPFAKGDAVHWESVIRPYSNFVYMIVRKA